MGQFRTMPCAALFTQTGQSDARHVQRLAIWQLDDGTTLTRARGCGIVNRLAITSTQRTVHEFHTSCTITKNEITKGWTIRSSNLGETSDTWMVKLNVVNGLVGF